MDQDKQFTDQDERPDVRAFRQFLLSDESTQFRQALTDLHLTLNLAAVTGQLPNPADRVEAARLIADNLQRHVGASDGDWAGPPGWVGPEAATTIDAVAYRGRAAELMAFGAFLLAAGVGDPDRFARELSRVTFGVDPYSTILGDVLGDQPLDVYPPQLPPELTGIRDFLDRTCVAGIASAAAQFGRVASPPPRPRGGGGRPPGDPDHGCAGDTVVIRGTGFGNTRPPNVAVMFTSRSGGCIAADVVSWSDTEITVTVPADVGRGCLGLVEHPAGFAGIAEAAAQFAGELETCLGPVAGIAGDRIRGSAIKVMAAACPDCSDPRTRFAGGPPVIRRFTANGDAVAEIVPGDDVIVTWQVDGADEVTIVAVGGVLPRLPGPFDPESGTVTVEDLALDDGTVGSWRLAATNRCGTTTAVVELVVRGRKALVLSGGGAKGAFEVGAVRCLRDVAGVRPEIISGASVGALNAAKLAEGGVALQDLEQLWLGMQNNTDLYLVLLPRNSYTPQAVKGLPA